jgi:uncharacterized protein
LASNNIEECAGVEDTTLVQNIWAFCTLNNIWHPMNLLQRKRIIFAIATAVALSVTKVNADDSRRCLAIQDVDQRVECLEGRLTDIPSVDPPQQRKNSIQGNTISPSFDCKEASTIIEISICNDSNLSRLDSDMARQYANVLKISRNRDLVISDQRKWISLRNSRCSWVENETRRLCLIEMTRGRIADLVALVLSVEKQQGRAVYKNVEGKTTTATNNSSPAQNDIVSQSNSVSRGTSGDLAAVKVTRDDATISNEKDSIWLPIVFLIILLAALAKLVAYLIRRNSLIKRYGYEIARKILSREVWQGMTSDQLIHSWGRPTDTDREIYKSRTKETWKYNQTGKNRFKDRIYLEDGIVVGWKEK